MDINVVIPKSWNPESNQMPVQIQHGILDSAGSCLISGLKRDYADNIRHWLTPTNKRQITIGTIEAYR